MKKVFFLTLVIVVQIVDLFSQKLQFTYEVDFPTITKSQYGSIVEFDNAVQMGRVGEPTLPFIPVSLLLPQATIARNVNFVFDKKIKIADNVDLMPFQNVRPYSDTSTLVLHRNEQAYNDEVYPSDRNFGFVNATMNGFCFLLSRFTPVEYNPKTREVFVYRQVTIQIEYSPDDEYDYKMLKLSEPIVYQVKKFAQNPQVADTYRSFENQTSGYDVLIICHDDYVNALSSLMAYYKNLGYSSRIKPLSRISTSYSGVDMPEKIRNCIKAEYQNASISYVTIAGDADLVPYRGLYCQVQSSQTYTDNSIPADIYYSGLDGNWNTDNDQLWGEPNEEDLLPDVSVARLPFSNVQELNNIINKLNKYTFSPITANNRLRSPLLAGEHLWSNPYTVGSQYLELLIGYHTDNGYTTNGIPSDHNITKLYYTETYSWGKTELLQHLNAGKSFVHHVGHANTDMMMYLNNSDIINQNFYNLNGTNENFTFVYSHGCYCGSFDANDCVSERMVTIQNFAVGVFTNSRYGWFNEGQTEGPSQHLHREFVDALYNDLLNAAGDAQKMSKIMTAPWIYQQNEWEPGAQRWCFYCHNALTDPVVPIWTDNPNTNFTVAYNSRFNKFTNNYVFVLSGDSPVKNARCVVMQNNEIVGKAYTNSDGEAVISLNQLAVAGPAQLKIFAYNAMPMSFDLTIYDPTVIDTNEKQFVVFPNPTSDYINVYFSKFNCELIQIQDLTGKVLVQKRPNTQNFQYIDISSLSRGVYMLVLKSSDEKIVRKIVKN